MGDPDHASHTDGTDSSGAAGNQMRDPAPSDGRKTQADTPTWPEDLHAVAAVAVRLRWESAAIEFGGDDEAVSRAIAIAAIDAAAEHLRTVGRTLDTVDEQSTTKPAFSRAELVLIIGRTAQERGALVGPSVAEAILDALDAVGHPITSKKKPGVILDGRVMAETVLEAETDGAPDSMGNTPSARRLAQLQRRRINHVLPADGDRRDEILKLADAALRSRGLLSLAGGADEVYDAIRQASLMGSAESEGNDG